MTTTQKPQTLTADEIKARDLARCREDFPQAPKPWSHMNLAERAAHLEQAATAQDMALVA